MTPLLSVQDLFKKIRMIKLRTAKLVHGLVAGGWGSAFKGKGIEFEEDREYEPGDEIRAIDWKVTARMNRPFVKTYREERLLSIMLLVDVSDSTLFGTKSTPKIHYMAELAAVFSLSAMQMNDKIGLILFAGDVEKYIPPKRGERHVHRVIRELLQHKSYSPGTHLKNALTCVERVQPKADVCILLSDFIVEEIPKNELLAAAKRHDFIAISVIDPFEEKPSEGPLVRFSDLETKKMQTVDLSQDSVRNHYKELGEKRRKAFKDFIVGCGASFLSFQTSKPYAKTLLHFFQNHGRGR